MGTAYFLWQLENPKPISDRRFFKRYLTFWHLYNMFADIFFLIGLLMKLLEIVLPADKELMEDSMIDMNGLAASGRILWGMAFALAILKTIKVWKLIYLKRLLDSLYDLHPNEVELVIKLNSIFTLTFMING